MMSNKLPSVLQGTGKDSSISMERALKQIQSLLQDHLDLLYCVGREDEGATEASLDDVETMLEAIDRG